MFPMRLGVAKGARARTAPGAAAALVPAAMVVLEIVFILCVVMVEVVGGIRLRVESRLRALHFCLQQDDEGPPDRSSPSGLRRETLPLFGD